jgi:hypothetical protein
MFGGCLLLWRYTVCWVTRHPKGQFKSKSNVKGVRKYFPPTSKIALIFYGKILASSIITTSYVSDISRIQIFNSTNSDLGRHRP